MCLKTKNIQLYLNLKIRLFVCQIMNVSTLKVGSNLYESEIRPLINASTKSQSLKENSVLNQVASLKEPFATKHSL